MSAVSDEVLDEGFPHDWDLPDVFKAARTLAREVEALEAERKTLRLLVVGAQPFVHSAARNYGPPEAKAWLVTAETILDNKGET